MYDWASILSQAAYLSKQVHNQLGIRSSVLMVSFLGLLWYILHLFYVCYTFFCLSSNPALYNTVWFWFLHVSLSFSDFWSLIFIILSRNYFPIWISWLLVTDLVMTVCGELLLLFIVFVQTENKIYTSMSIHIRGLQLSNSLQWICRTMYYYFPTT